MRVPITKLKATDVIYRGKVPQVVGEAPVLIHPGVLVTVVPEAEAKAVREERDRWAKGGGEFVYLRSTPQDEGYAYSTHGADPEAFVAVNGKLRPAYKFLVAGNKEQHAFEAPYWDGFQGEFTVYPHSCLQAVTASAARGLNALVQEAGEGAEIYKGSTIEVPEKELETADERHVELGCDPSFNVYGDCGEPVLEARKLRYRFAGGHLHYAVAVSRSKWDLKSAPARVEEIVKMMDIGVGIPSVLLANGWDSPIRRRYYGRAGEFRLPEHGLEYRVLSNYWLQHPAMMHLTLGIARAAFWWGYRGRRHLFDVKEDEVRHIINDSDIAGAIDMMTRLKEMYLILLREASSLFPVVKGGIRRAVLETYAKILKCAEEPLFLTKEPVMAYWRLSGGGGLGQGSQWYEKVGA